MREREIINYLKCCQNLVNHYSLSVVLISQTCKMNKLIKYFALYFINFHRGLGTLDCLEGIVIYYLEEHTRFMWGMSFIIRSGVVLGLQPYLNLMHPRIKFTKREY